MRKQIVILTFVLLIFCSASAMADTIELKLIESISLTKMTLTIEGGAFSGDHLSYKNENRDWAFALNTVTDTITATAIGDAVAPLEFSLWLTNPTSGLTITFAAIPENADYATITYNSNGTWEVTNTKDILVAPEPSLILLLGIGLGAVTLTFWRKKE